MIELRTLGTLELTADDGTPLENVLAQPRRLALLCYLALAAPRGFQRRDTLYALFWPEHDAERARHALRQSLYFLRRALGAKAIVSRGDDDLALAPDRVRCDAAEFERAADDGRPEEALALYRGDLLVGFHISDAPEFERWLDGERARLRQRAAEAAWRAATAREEGGDPAGAAEWARRAARFSPGDETTLRRLVVLLDRLGDRAAAVRAYEAFERDLEREYELEPSPETRALLLQVRQRREARVEPVNDPPVAAPSVAAPPVAAPPVVAPLPAPEIARRRRPRAAWVSAAALLALVVLLGAGVWRFTPRVRPQPPDAVASGSGPERIIVADFRSLTSDSTLGDLVAHVLRNELARSPRFGVTGRERIGDALRRMRRNPGTPLTGDVAREVAAREGIKAVVEGDVRPAGSGLVISAAIVEAASGDIIHGASESARDSTEVLAAIARLSERIREGAGESLASIRATSRPWSFTTSSLGALRKQMAGIEARQRGDYIRAAELLEEAVALDPDFAHGYASLAGQLEDAGLPVEGRVLSGLVRAYALRDRLTERERAIVEARYYLNVTGDVEHATAALWRHLEAVKPTGEGGWASLLPLTLVLRGDLAAAEDAAAAVEAVVPGIRVGSLQVEVLHARGKPAEAARQLDDLARRFPTHPRFVRLRVETLAAAGRYDDAHALAAGIRRESGLQNDLRTQAELDAARGRLREAVGHLRDLRDQAVVLGRGEAALEIAVAAGRLRLLAGDSSGAAEVDDLLARRPIDSLDVLRRPYLQLALFSADAGRATAARAWLGRYEREYPAEFGGPDRWMLHRVRAALHRADGNPAAALAELRQAAAVPALRAGLFADPFIRVGDHPELARAYEAAGASDSAVAVYERYLAARSLSRTTVDAFELGRALERLGALYERRGDRARASAAYHRLAELWADADEPLRSRAAAAALAADQAAER